MGKKILPLKFDLVKFMVGKDEVSALELFDNAKITYEGERQLSYKDIEKHLSALRAAGLIEMVNAKLDGDGSLLCSYRLTDYGNSRLKYIPQD